MVCHCSLWAESLKLSVPVKDSVRCTHRGGLFRGRVYPGAGIYAKNHSGEPRRPQEASIAEEAEGEDLLSVPLPILEGEAEVEGHREGVGQPDTET